MQFSTLRMLKNLKSSNHSMSIQTTNQMKSIQTSNSSNLFSNKSNLSSLERSSMNYSQFPNNNNNNRSLFFSTKKNFQSNSSLISTNHKSNTTNNINIQNNFQKNSSHYSIISRPSFFQQQQQIRTLVTHTPSEQKEMMKPVALHSILTKPTTIPPNSKKQKNVLVLHGLFGQGKNWRGVTRKFPDQENVICHLLDLRCHGTSPRSPYLTYSAMAEDILYYINNHNLDEVSIIGHSMVM